ncbi:MAG: hypothetical protein EXR58_05415 [Chloroflexi bacterium]|nr:hypothetical protein [Chloroflexota bacterium]
MNFAGDSLLHAPQQRVWDALLDPEVLAKCLPGCERLETTGPDTYSAVVSLGLAAVKGTYTGQVKISEKREPDQYVMAVEGTGSSGTVKGTATMTLSATTEGTSVHWNADVQIGGPIAGVGQRLFGGVSKLVAGEFFKKMDQHLTQDQ